MKIEDRITKARLNLIIGSPFFGMLSMRLIMKQDTTIPTACTDGKEMLYNPSFMDKFNDAEIKGVLCHELLHCALSHMTRRNLRDMERWNIAADHVINLQLLKENFKLPAGCLADSKYANKSTEEVYSLIQQEENGSGKKPNPGTDCGQVKDGQKPQDVDGKNKQEEDWKEATAQAAQYARKQGKLSADLERLAGKIINPPADWKSLLAQFITQNSKNDYSWNKPNRRFIYQGLYIPSLDSPELPPVTIAVDTSGSIDNDILAQFEGEISNILETYQTTARVIYCDAEITKEETFETAPVKFKPRGGGGTDFRPVFNLLDQEPPQFLIYLTDGYGSYPSQESEYPVLWAMFGEHKKAPFGTTIELI